MSIYNANTIYYQSWVSGDPNSTEQGLHPAVHLCPGLARLDFLKFNSKPTTHDCANS